MPNNMTHNVKPIPEGFHTITPYLTVPAVAKLIDFLKQAFDAIEIERMARPDGTVHHAEVKIGDSIVMLGEPPDPSKAKPGALYLYVKDVDATYRRAIQAGAASLSEPVDMFYGDRGAGVQDGSGNTWWIATHIEDVAPEELQRRAVAAGRA
jgi:PhnB protein